MPPAWGMVSAELVGRRISAIQFVTEAAIDEQDFRRELPLQEDEALTESRLRESLDWLRTKEIFAAADAECAPEGEDVRVTFRLVPAEVVVGVEIHGAKEVSEADVRRRARIREDELLSAPKMAAAADRVRTLYEDRGFPDTDVTITPRTQEAGRIVVHIRIQEAEPILIDDVDVRGLPESVVETDDILGLRKGDRFTAARAKTAREALVRALRKRSYYEVEVREAHELRERKAHLWFDVELGPPFEIEILGNDQIERPRLLGLTDLTTRPIITNGTWRLLARRMEELYHDQGYRFAEVKVEIDEDREKRVRFRIVEGPRVHVKNVRLDGVQAVSRKDLLGVMQTQPPSGFAFWRRRGWLRPDVLAEDRDRLAQFYRSRGFLDMKIVDVDYDFSGDRSSVTIIIDVAEGRRSQVTRILVEGTEGALEAPEQTLKLTPGAAFDPMRLAGDRDRLAERLASKGYAQAKIDTTIERAANDDDAIAVTIRHSVTRNAQIRVGRIFIQQNYFTRDRVIRRELPFGSGDPFDPAMLVEAQRRLYRLGLFRSVAIRPVETAGDLRDVIVRVVERPGGEIEYGFGYNTRSGLRNFAQIGHRNIAGTARSASLRGELNLSPDNLEPDEYVAGVETKEPRFLGSSYDLRNHVILQRSERSIDEFSIRRFSFSTGLEREFLAGLRASVLLEFEDSRIFDVAPDAVLTGQDVGELRTVSVNPILVYDGRDDAFAPTRGVFETLRLRYGTPALGSEVHFAKVTAQHSQYVPLSSRWTFLYAARLGLAEPLGSSEVIPIRERFFLGGRTSVRGFEENSIGPRGDEGNPVGGDLLVSGNAELRFPLFWGIGGAAFVDGGGLYLRDQGVSLGEFRESAGPGLRYLTPVGAISLDYGFKLDRREGESLGEIHFTIGNIF
jgi:outer membrane protein insertion porin family